jgi:hypothetical protein
MQKIRYEIDPHNRLVACDTGGKTGLPRFRQVLDGEFRTDEYNNLSYHMKSPLSKGEDMPHQIKLKGEWSLTEDHRLRLTFDKLGRETFGDQMTLEGKILDVGRNSLLFAVTTTAKEDTASTYVLNLSGSWKADENNRLSFHARREKGRHDILTLSGAWEINKNHEIIYRYEKARLLRKKREVRTLTFKGHWDIKEALRVSYLVGGGTDSLFDFAVAAGIFKEDHIRFEVGIALAGRRKPVKRTVTLFGRWNLKKGAGLFFEVEYGEEGTKAIAFGAEARLTDKETVIFRLKNQTGKRDIGVEVELSRRMLKGGGEAFLRALKSRDESALYAGAAWRW